VFDTVLYEAELRSSAALYATVSASFVVEQVGLPILTPALQTSEERWNDDEPRRRLAELAARVKGGSTM